MSTIEQKFLVTLKQHKLIPQNQSIVAAVSGGPDSICLLHLLSSLLTEANIHAVYIDHHLRPDETTGEKKLVEEQCRQLSVEFHLRFIDVPKEVELTGDSIEACARKLRYRELEDLRQSVGAGAIAVGHTSDDQAEEVLIRLIRGSGLKGLSGMSHKNGRVIRPLLDIGKAEILEYLADRHIAFRHDSSNDSRHFLRNRVRLDLLPFLEEQFNPSIRKNLIKTALLLKDEDSYLNTETTRLFDSVVHQEQSTSDTNDPVLSLSLVKLSDQHTALQRRVFEMALWKLNSRPNSTIIEDLINLGRRGNNGAELHLPNRTRAVKQNDALVLSRLPMDQKTRDSLQRDVDIRMEIPGPGTYACDQLCKRLLIKNAADRDGHDKNSLVVNSNRLTYPLTLRLPVPGERFYPRGGQGSRKISRFLNDRKIPKHQRPHYPVLLSGNEIVCVLGLSVDERYSVIEKNANALSIEWLNEA